MHDDENKSEKKAEEKAERNKPLDERKIPEKIRLQQDCVSAKGKQFRKGETVEVDDEEGHWPDHRAVRYVDKGFAVDANDPDLDDEEVTTLDDASGLKRRGKAKRKK